MPGQTTDVHIDVERLAEWLADNVDDGGAATWLLSEREAKDYWRSLARQALEYAAVEL